MARLPLNPAAACRFRRPGAPNPDEPPRICNNQSPVEKLYLAWPMPTCLYLP